MAETEKPEKKGYEPEKIEANWYNTWLEKGYFKPEVNPDGKPFSIVIPPPNVTGSLHMGHALNATLQDILARWKRMSGYKVLWVPGTDHAGIATQNVVERELAKEKLDRHQLGREAFIERVWKWRAEYGGRIIYQLKKMGASCDWSRERFTLDEGLNEAVRTVFVRLYEEGLIYRSGRLINWCPRCRTALSDLEVEHEEEQGLLTHIKYPFSDGSGHITVATTRPETMLGDTAVAVNPEDERYKDAIGKTIALPLTCRAIPVVADPEVDMEFGTGAVKVTPAHDFNDEAIAKRQSPPLESIKVIGADAKMTPEAGAKYAGMDRYDTRKAVVEDLKKLGLLVEEKKHMHSIGHCYRCKTVIEPLSTPQWYVKIAPLAEEAMKAVREGRIKIVPESWNASFFAWMENIKDWCISRQIWWGHRIPVWYCEGCGKIIVAMEAPKTCPDCGLIDPVQDDDVLDTWFSSALWPFSTLGWPGKNIKAEDLLEFYPTSVLVTAFDILFFWVARMMMMGLKFMGDVPFRAVYIHALIRDEEGQKMSKSKGNVIDPLIMIEKHGTDAFRFTLTAFAAQGRDIRFSEERVKGYRFFINKLWNATRFIQMNTAEPVDLNASASDLPSRWITSRFAAASRQVEKALSEYRFNDAANAVYHFLWHEFCDWYIEMAKVGLQNESEAASGVAAGVRACLLKTLEGVLRLLHPFMPFVTEELWQGLPQGLRQGESIMLARFPSGLETDEEAEKEMGIVMDAVLGVRNIRGELNIQPAAKIKISITDASPEAVLVLESYLDYIKRLAGAQEVVFQAEAAASSSGVGKGAVSLRTGFTVCVPLEGLIDVKGELARLEKELKKVSEDLEFVDKKLRNEDFVDKAPQKVVEKEKAKLEELSAKKDSLLDNIGRLKNLEVENE